MDLCGQEGMPTRPFLATKELHQHPLSVIPFSFSTCIDRYYKTLPRVQIPLSHTHSHSHSIAIAIPLQPTPVLTNSAAHPETDLVPVLPVDQATDTALTLVLALETDQTATAEEEIATEETGTGTGTTEIVPIDEEIDPGFHPQLYMEGGAMVPPGNLGRNQSGDQ